MRIILESSALLLGTVSLFALAGCDSEIVGGGGDGGGGGAGPTSQAVTVGSATSGAGNGSATATSGSGATYGPVGSVAFYRNELVEPPGSLFCESADCPADMLFLFADTVGPTCADPFWDAPDMGPNPQGPDRKEWAIVVGVPADQQQVGTYALTGNQEFYVSQGSLEVENSGGVVGATGGFGDASGTLEIVSIDATSIRYRVSGVSWNFSSDGEYVATRCGAATPPSP